MKIRHVLAAMTAAYLVPISAHADVIATWEAEDTTITCQASPHPGVVSWASGQAMAPISWGRAAGDKLEFSVGLSTPESNPVLAVRYAYFEEWHRRDVESPAPRELMLTVDNLTTYSVDVPDTGSWNHFEVAEVELGPLAEGVHTFQLSSPARFACTNVDTFVLYTPPVKKLDIGVLRPTRLVDAEKGIVLAASDKAVLLESPTKTHAELQKLFDLVSRDFASPDVKVFFHLTDTSRWWKVDEPVVQCKFGIYVLADGSAPDKTKWCYALAKHFLRNSGVPVWFADSSARISGLIDWLPAVDFQVPETDTRRLAETLVEAEDFLGNSSTCDNVDVVHLALRLRFGSDIFQRFWTHLAEKRKAGQAPKRLDKIETLALLSEVAGEDVLPIYQRWTGFESEGPVEPLIRYNDVPPPTW